MKWLLDFIRPPEDATWKAVNRWRWNVAIVLAAVAALTGWSYGPKGFAGQEVVDKKIAAAQRPLIEAQKKTDEKVDRMSELLTSQLADSKAAQIRLNISKRCKTVDFNSREELNREKDRLQNEYVKITGERYIEPSCGDL